MGLFSSKPYGKNKPSIPDSLDDDSDYIAEIQRQREDRERKIAEIKEISDAKPSEYYFMLVYTDLAPIAIEQLNRYKSTYGIDWLGPTYEEDYTMFRVRAPSEVLATLRAAGYTKALYGDRAFQA